MNKIRIIFSLILGVLLWSSLLSPSFANRLEENQQSTVLVFVGNGTGTGFVVGDSDYVVTNHHVIAEFANGGTVAVLFGPEEGVKAQVIWSSEQKDLAVLKLEVPIDRPAVTFTKAEDVKVADPVYVMGFPGAANLDGALDEATFTTVKVAKGIISAKVKDKAGVALFQTDAPINPGNSGGPLFTESGSVIGINSMASLVKGIIVDQNGNQETERIRKGDNIGWSIQADELLVELDALGIPYDIEGRSVASDGSLMDKLTFGLVLLAVLLAGGALFLALTKKGRVVVKEVSRRIRPMPAANIPVPPVRNIPPQVPVPSQPTKTQPVLIGISGHYAGQKFPLTGPITLGRSPSDSQLVVPASEVSGKHCVVGYSDTQKSFTLMDTGSTNGTFLESGQRLQPMVVIPLRSGQKFFLSNPNHQFEVRLEQA